MKKYSSARAGRGKTAYRTPSSFRYRQVLKTSKIKQGSCLSKKANRRV